jgi:hypothetical protein
MNALGTITMSMHELDRLKVIQAVCESRLKPGQAAVNRPGYRRPIPASKLRVSGGVYEREAAIHRRIQA